MDLQTRAECIELRINDQRHVSHLNLASEKILTEKHKINLTSGQGVLDIDNQPAMWSPVPCVNDTLLSTSAGDGVQSRHPEIVGFLMIPRRRHTQIPAWLDCLHHNMPAKRRNHASSLKLAVICECVCSNSNGFGTNLPRCCESYVKGCRCIFDSAI